MFFLQPKSSKINPHTISQATGRMSAWRPSRTTLNFASRVLGRPSRLEARRFSGNPVSGAYAGTLQGVRGRKWQEVDTSRASRTTGEDSLSREIIRFRGESVRCRHLPLPSPLSPCYIPNPPQKQDCPKIVPLPHPPQEPHSPIPHTLKHRKKKWKCQTWT